MSVPVDRHHTGIGHTSGDGADADVFGRLALELHDAGGLEETVETVVQFALDALRCEYAALVLVDPDQQVEILAQTDPQVTAFYQLQLDAGDGPMLTAIREAHDVLVADVAAVSTWSPAWTAAVRDAGVRSVAHLPLLANRQVAAVLSLYAAEPNAFAADELAVAHILARHASVAVATARHEADLMQAVDARKLIGQAMGILMERYGLDSDQSFEVLRRYSQQNNRTLRDAAQDLIDSRRLRR
jgi:GAF domain-containing protein